LIFHEFFIKLVSIPHQFSYFLAIGWGKSISTLKTHKGGQIDTCSFPLEFLLITVFLGTNLSMIIFIFLKLDELLKNLLFFLL